MVDCVPAYVVIEPTSSRRPAGTGGPGGRCVVGAVAGGRTLMGGVVATVVVESLRKVFETPDRTVVAIDDISFEIADQTFVSVVGPSGCGKSTLLNVLWGSRRRRRGVPRSRTARAQAKVGYVFQAPRLLPWRTVIDNMMFVQSERTPEVPRPGVPVPVPCGPEQRPEVLPLAALRRHAAARRHRPRLLDRAVGSC